MRARYVLAPEETFLQLGKKHVSAALKGLNSNNAAYPALKRWAMMFRPAGGTRLLPGSNVLAKKRGDTPDASDVNEATDSVHSHYAAVAGAFSRSTIDFTITYST